MEYKVIDLINDVANDKAPKKIIYDITEYKYDDDKKDYIDIDGKKLFEEYMVGRILNEEVEIIEEDKEIEEIEIDYLFKNFEGNKGNIFERLDKNFKEIEYYLKALANAVNELKKGK